MTYSLKDYYDQNFTSRNDDKFVDNDPLLSQDKTAKQVFENFAREERDWRDMLGSSASLFIQPSAMEVHTTTGLGYLGINPPTKYLLPPWLTMQIKNPGDIAKARERTFNYEVRWRGRDEWAMKYIHHPDWLDYHISDIARDMRIRLAKELGDPKRIVPNKGTEKKPSIELGLTPEALKQKRLMEGVDGAIHGLPRKAFLISWHQRQLLKVDDFLGADNYPGLCAFIAASILNNRDRRQSPKLRSTVIPWLKELSKYLQQKGLIKEFKVSISEHNKGRFKALADKLNVEEVTKGKNKAYSFDLSIDQAYIRYLGFSARPYILSDDIWNSSPAVGTLIKKNAGERGALKDNILKKYKTTEQPYYCTETSYVWCIQKEKAEKESSDDDFDVNDDLDLDDGNTAENRISIFPDRNRHFEDFSSAQFLLLLLNLYQDSLFVGSSSNPVHGSTSSENSESHHMNNINSEEGRLVGNFVSKVNLLKRSGEGGITALNLLAPELESVRLCDFNMYEFEFEEDRIPTFAICLLQFRTFILQAILSSTTLMHNTLIADAEYIAYKLERVLPRLEELSDDAWRFRKWNSIALRIYATLLSGTSSANDLLKEIEQLLAIKGPSDLESDNCKRWISKIRDGLWRIKNEPGKIQYDPSGRRIQLASGPKISIDICEPWQEVFEHWASLEDLLLIDAIEIANREEPPSLLTKFRFTFDQIRSFFDLTSLLESEPVYGRSRGAENKATQLSQEADLPNVVAMPSVLQKEEDGWASVGLSWSEGFSEEPYALTLRLGGQIISHATWVSWDKDPYDSSKGTSRLRFQLPLSTPEIHEIAGDIDTDARTIEIELFSMEMEKGVIATSIKPIQQESTVTQLILSFISEILKIRRYLAMEEIPAIGASTSKPTYPIQEISFICAQDASYRLTFRADPYNDADNFVILEVPRKLEAEKLVINFNSRYQLTLTLREEELDLNTVHCQAIEGFKCFRWEGRLSPEQREYLENNPDVWSLFTISEIDKA